MKNLNKKGLLGYILGIVLLCLIDQLTKIAAVSALKGNSPFVLIKNVLEFYYLENAGMAWGMMSGARIYFLVLTVLIVGVITYVIIKMPRTRHMLPFSAVLTVLASGALGNFIDRLTLGYVRDFIYFKLINFPVFNVADIYVTVSVICFVILILFYYKEEDFNFLKKADKTDTAKQKNQESDN